MKTSDKNRAILQSGSELFIGLLAVGLFSVSLAAAEEPSAPFSGSWAFELPDGNPAWLKISEGEDGPEGHLLWSVGSARPVTDLEVAGEAAIRFARKLKWKPGGKADDVWLVEKPIEGTLKGPEKLELRVVQHPDGKPDAEQTFTMIGTKMPPMPPRSNLDEVEFGDPLSLFNGEDLTGWKLANPEKKNGWRAENGVLINETPKTDFSAYGDYGNLVTEAVFEDFRLTLEYNVPDGGNSGVYLRGMYEAQVVDRDSKMQGISGPGAIFGRIEPSENAAKPGGEWNRYVLTLVDRHVTVELNGRVVIDNQPLEGCTGGGISADDTKPGPIFLQGDHTAVRYREIVIEEVVR